MTRDHWDRLEKLHWKKLRKKYPTAPLFDLRRQLYESMVLEFGPRPKGPSRPPWYLRLGLKLLIKKFVKEDTKMQMSPLLNSILFGLTAGIAAAQAAAGDGVVSGAQEWLGIAMAAMTGFWGKRSNSRKLLSHKD